MFLVIVKYDILVGILYGIFVCKYIYIFKEFKQYGEFFNSIFYDSIVKDIWKE